MCHFKSLIIIDSREKPRAINLIIDYFDRHNIQHMTSKLLFGDYMEYNHPSVVIDRKQNIGELAKNCTIEHDRFRRELERCQAAGATLIILVEQNTYTDRGQRVKVRGIDDLLRWDSKFTIVKGEKVYRVLKSWMAKYPLRVEFCDKRGTGKRIINLLSENEFGDN